ncbi:DrmE family protein [Chitinophaga cymbidii]|uniref:DISARM protein DrmE C-terminal domain-containing protein n=1 Tax=Chitinophaga cymbidii TaxID=1096750 RepID=A0A512RIJ7_9BACT|nr:DrmE family protein [Chitinophaga cymbidii]GEP95529.1 hypothetical protein CCY01nite_17890 [Chitinophaga cymbidii]
MSQEFIHKLLYTCENQSDGHALPTFLKNSLRLIEEFFAHAASNKLCLVFPAKDYVAQWLSLNLSLDHLQSEFRENRQDIFEAYKVYKPGQKLLLNNKAVVEWVKGDEVEIVFKTKGTESKNAPWQDTNGDYVSLKTSRIDNLKPAPASRKVLSPRKAVYENLLPKSNDPVDDLLGISSKGNFVFLKKPVCLVSRIKSADESLGKIYLNKQPLADFFRIEKISDTGISIPNAPLLIAGNLSYLTMYTIVNPISKIIIDGFSAIQERRTDFSDVDAKGIPTILITDLSEIESFEHISDFGFEFYNFTKDQFVVEKPIDHSPFQLLNRKVKNYTSFLLSKELCSNDDLDALIHKIHSIEKDESNNDLNILKIRLIQLANKISAVVHPLTKDELAELTARLNEIEILTAQSNSWLGDAGLAIGESTALLRLLIDKLALAPSEKYIRMLSMLQEKRYDYIICPTEIEVAALKNFISKQPLAYKPKVIAAGKIASMANTIGESSSALLTGWPKSSNTIRLLTSFLFSEITFLFYHFENRYFNSLQRRNQKQCNCIKATVNSNGVRLEEKTPKDNEFSLLYKNDENIMSTHEADFDILRFELELDSVQYSKYIAKGVRTESERAKRIDFENECFFYTTESHKFLVINELIEKRRKRPVFHTKRVDAIISGDVIALISAYREILARLVEQNTRPEDLDSVNKWIQLWKTLLKEYYASVGNDFKKLVEKLRTFHCTKHEATIKNWLLDESRIGPDDDSDLISIAMLTGSDLLHDNIDKVRDAVRRMTGWRMRMSDIISNKIREKLYGLADHSIIGTKIQVEELGVVNILKVAEIQSNWQLIDSRFVNKLLQKELI